MTKLNVYRALFPPHYTPRRPYKPGNSDWNRTWHTLELPYIRVMGLLWSFGFKVGSPPTSKGLPGLEHEAARAVARSLRVIYERDVAEPLGDLPAFHAPVLLRAEVERILQPVLSSKRESRLSLLAVDTISPGHVTAEGELTTIDASDLGFTDDAELVGGTTRIIVSPFGDNPGPSGSGDGQYLPAMQLMHGAIRYTAADAYLAMLRKKLGLGKPADLARANEIVLLPTGFCLAGTIELPWVADPVEGWFQATLRSLAPDGAVERGLTPWFGPHLDEKHDLRAEWNGHVRELASRLDRAGNADEAPRWLRLTPKDGLGPEQLFWPEVPSGSPLLSRAHTAERPVEVDGAGLALRLADRVRPGEAAVGLAIEPASFAVSGASPSAVAIAADVGSDEPGDVRALYRFDPTRADARERVSFEAGDATVPIVLALPLIETAERLRAAARLPPPPPTEPLGLLWAFSPLPGGWLHWPLANATPANLSPIAETPPTAPADHPGSAGLAGALAFGHRPGDPGLGPAERVWAIFVSRARGCRVDVRLDMSGEAAASRVLSAEIDLDDVALAFEGVFPATAFRQTPERLLPDHPERALGTFGLRAISPADLRGLEAQMWAQADEPDRKARIRIEAALTDLEITADPQGRGRLSPAARVALTTVIAGAAGDRAPWPDALRPWIWRSEPRLPCIQTLPLAATGRARNAPSGVRAFAPLRLAAGPKDGRLTYQVALDMGAVASEIEIDPGEAPRFERPAPSARWRDEVGMAVATLPSATFRVGVPDAGAGAVPLSGGWNGLNTAVSFELRHDLALRDEHHAFARAPARPPPEPDVKGPRSDPEPPPPEAVFVPLPNNGPDDAPCIKYAETRTNGWDDVWRVLNRKAALAALDDRAMLAASGHGGRELVGLFGDASYPLTNVSLTRDTSMVASEPGDDGEEPGRRIGAIGRLDLAFEDAPGAKTAFPGLPDEGDLVGLEGEFPREGTPTAIRFGTARLGRSGGRFADQHGLDWAPVEADERVVVRPVRNRAGEPNDIRLVTLKKPVAIAGKEVLTFWCADIPVGPDGALPSLALGGTAEDRANAADRRHNHLTAFRWRLGGTRAGDLVVIGGLVFEPLALRGFKQDGHALPKLIKIRGRLHLPLPGDSPRPCEGTATLTLWRSSGSGETYEAFISASDILIPLSPPEDARGYAPRLRLRRLPAIGPTRDATLDYVFGDETTTVAIKITRAADGTLALSGQPTPSGPGAASELGSVEPASLKLTLKGAQSTTGGGIGTSDLHLAAVDYAMEAGPDGARLRGTCTLDLLGDGQTTVGLTHRFPDAHSLAVEPVGELGFSPGTLTLCWRKAEGATATLLGGLNVSAARGCLIAALRRRPSGPATLPSFDVVDLETRAWFDLTTFVSGSDGPVPLTLALDRIEDTFGYRLSGELLLTNAFSWPKLAVQGPTNGWLTARFDHELDEVFVHTVTLNFDGQSIATGRFGKTIPLAVEARHAIRLGAKGAPLISWRAFQTVTLGSATALAKELEAFEYPVQNPEKAGTALSPVAGPIARPLVDHRVLPHILHRGAADDGAAAGALATKLLAYLKTVPATLAVDVSHHALLAFDAAHVGAAKLSGELILAGLPALGLAASTRFDSSFPGKLPDDLAGMLASRPTAAATLFLSPTDGYAAHAFPALPPRLAEEASRQARAARGRRSRRTADLASVALCFDGEGRPHRPVFQPVVFKPVAHGKPVVPVDNLPAAGTAFFLAGLLDAPRDRNPLALTFGTSGGMASDDFFDGQKPDPYESASVFNAADYSHALTLFRARAIRNLVPGPDAVAATTAPEAPPAVRIELEAVARGGGAVATIAARTFPPMTADDLKRLLANADTWAKRALQRSAPWARSGLVTIRDADFGLTRIGASLVVVLPSQSRDSLRPRPFPQIMHRQPQREMAALLAPAADGVAEGYAPLAVDPVLYAAEAPGETPDRAGGPLLATTGFELVAALAGGTHALLEAAPLKDQTRTRDVYWVADRDRTGFRPFALPDPVPYDLTFALPDGDGALPESLLPSWSVDATEKHVSDTDRLVQAYAPARITTGRLAGRAGAWTATRSGLVQVSAGELFRASEIPVHVRQPRPPLLGRNDRPRASSHESGHVATGDVQTYLVHGPRARRIGQETEPTGLDRSPRSLWATRLALTGPTGSIVPSDWDGAVVLEAGAPLGAPETTPSWTVTGAALLIDDDRYEAASGPTTIEHASSAPLRFGDFKREGTPPRPAAGVLRSLPAGTEIIFSLELSYAETQGSDRFLLTRQVRFSLLTSGTSGTAARLEPPVFFRFDDPEFNDRLGGLAKLSREPSRQAPTDDFVLAADLSELRPDQRLEVALALRPSRPDLAVQQVLTRDGADKGWLYGSPPQKIWLTLERMRSGERDQTRLRALDPSRPPVNNASAREEAFLLLAPPGLDHSTFQALTVDCAGLVAGDGSRLAAGDRLRLSVVLAASAGEVWTSDGASLISLTCDIVAEPSLPANPAAFGVLALTGPKDGSEPRVSMELYAQGPDAVVIEIVDPRDLAEGMVRRRAAYLWRSHAARWADRELRFALQKVSGTGSTWIPSELEAWPASAS